MNQIEMPVNFINKKLVLLDQRKLPHQEVFVEIASYQEAHHAIRDMVVRGAPCIGFTGIFAMALGVLETESIHQKDLKKIADFIVAARPTAVNLEFEVYNIVDKILSWGDLARTEIFEKIVA